MYGLPAGTQLHAGQFQHDSLREANAARRHRVDTDFDHDVARAQHLHHRVVAAAAIITATLSGLVLLI